MIWGDKQDFKVTLEFWGNTFLISLRLKESIKTELCLFPYPLVKSSCLFFFQPKGIWLEIVNPEKIQLRQMILVFRVLLTMWRKQISILWSVLQDDQSWFQCYQFSKEWKILPSTGLFIKLHTQKMIFCSEYSAV